MVAFESGGEENDRSKVDIYDYRASGAFITSSSVCGSAALVAGVCNNPFFIAYTKARNAALLRNGT